MGSIPQGRSSSGLYARWFKVEGFWGYLGYASKQNKIIELN